MIKNNKNKNPFPNIFFFTYITPLRSAILKMCEKIRQTFKMEKKKTPHSKDTPSSPLEKALDAVEKMPEELYVKVPAKATQEMAIRVSKALYLPTNTVRDVYNMMIEISQES